jgi:hypothetical protein
MNTAILVLSCGKRDYAVFRNKLQKTLENLDIPIYFLFGTPDTSDSDLSLADANNVFKIIAPCGDYYEDIPQKMYHGFLSLINLGYDYIIKIDENIEITDPTSFLRTACEELKGADYLALKGVSYRGLKYQDSSVEFSFSHVGKVRDKRLEMMPTVIPKCMYAGGPAYAVSRKALLTLQKTEYDRALNEDAILGFHMFSAGISLVESKVLDHKLIVDSLVKFYPPAVNIISNGKATIERIRIVNRKRLYVDINGGLGNQLFQIANGLQYALKNNYDFFPIYDPTNERGYFWDSFLSNFKHILLTIPDTIHIVYKESSFGYKEIPSFNTNLHFHGYFQSSKYCSLVKTQIKSIMKFPSDVKSILESKYGSFIFNSNVVLVHARQGDYKTKADFHGPLKQSYYKNVKTLVETVIPDPFYLLTSDDDYWIANNVFGENPLF